MYRVKLIEGDITIRELSARTFLEVQSAGSDIERLAIVAAACATRDGRAIWAGPGDAMDMPMRLLKEIADEAIALSGLNEDISGN